MEPSPLTQQARPEAFQPKVVELYQALFKTSNDLELSEGFWTELFLLRPDVTSLREILSSLSASDVLLLQHRTCSFFLRAINNVKAGNAPSDEIALQTLTVLLSNILTKKYNNPSSDIIELLCGLDQADTVLFDFVVTLDSVIRNGRNYEIRKKAVDTAKSMVSGAYYTGLVSYFIHRDLFPSIMKFIQDTEDVKSIESSSILLGLLVNYNKFEFQNPYKMRLDDFVNEKVIQKIVLGVASSCAAERDRYIEIQNDAVEGWGIGNTLTSIGLGTFLSSSRPSSRATSPETAKEQFTSLPTSQVAILLANYDFANANKLFCFNLLVQSNDSSVTKTETPFAAFLSQTSYLLQHAHRNTRTSLYAFLNLLTIRILIEDQVLGKKICDEDNKIVVRLCRQRQPYLPISTGSRVPATVVMDLITDGINHNLRRRLDVDLYLSLFGLLQRMISYLSRSRTRLAYHWSELWRSLLSFIRFLTSYADSLRSLSNMQTLIDAVVNIIALSLSTGESFLPGPKEYDDLFYKLVETGDFLTKFRDSYDLQKRSESSLPTLIDVSKHYEELLQKSTNGRRSKQLDPAQVSTVIKQGYETLNISTKEGLEQWTAYREADYKSVLKKIARIVVADVRHNVDLGS